MGNIHLNSTKDFTQKGVKVLVYGNAGAGKTYLCSTLPKVLIVSAESGLLTLRNHNLPYITVKSSQDLADVYRYITESDEAKQFESIALDSVSEIAEVCLSEYKESEKDGRQAYMKMQEDVVKILRSFRDIEKNVYFSAKMERTEDADGNLYYAPSFPGKNLTTNVSYFFDEVFALLTRKNEEGKIERSLLTQTDNKYIAKDRSGVLDMYEEADLGKVIAKIGSTK